MNPEDKKFISDQVKTASYFAVAALSPSFLISLFCLFAYLVTQFPEIKEPLSKLIEGLLSKAGVKVSGESEKQ